MIGKKAQPSGAAAASLVLVVGAFILIFIILLPSEERGEVRGGKESGVSAGGGEELIGVLLEERPGTVTKLREREFEHSIPSFNLFTEKEDTIIKKVDSVFIESSGIDSRTIPLYIKDKTENGRLTFFVNDYDGRLTVLFNDNEIFKGEVNTVMDPLSIGELKEENLIQFSVDSPAKWQFWKNNFYDIRNVQVAATVEKVENKEAVNTFFVSEEEADVENIEEAFIIYLVDCRVSEVGKLIVLLNNNLLSSKVPDCGSLEKTFIDPVDFVKGKNELRFVSEEGNYLIDQIFVKTKLRKPIFPVYFFDINDTQFERIENNTLNASVILKFIDDGERKNAVIELNSHRISVNTRGGSFSKNIDAFMIEGSNSIRITPEKTLHVLELKVELDCKKEKDCS